MKIIFSKKKLAKIVTNEKMLGFVPTMGAIHKGHLSLIKASNKMCKKTLVSIFINKPQFNKKKDFQKYPRSIKKDKMILRKNKVDFLFVPTMKQMYPRGQNNNIKIIPFGKKLCGKFRLGHFEAIADVIDRFIKIIKPEKIFLGEKDMQQLKILDSFVKRKYPKIKVIGCKTVREKNGIALSSRNSLLTKNEIVISSNIYKFIKKNKKKICSKKISTKYLKNVLLNFGIKKIEYINIIDINKILRPFVKTNNDRIFIAYYHRTIRLIDNI